MAKTLTRSVWLDNELLLAGTELTDEQAERITNPKAFEDEQDHTGPDANDARAYQNHVRAENNDKALRNAPAQDSGQDPSQPQEPNRGAAEGAKLARGGRASAPAAKE